MYDAPGARGISNAGNTCFLSATIQALSHAHLLRDFWLLLPQRLAVQATAPSDAQAFATASRMRRTATMLGDRRLQLLTRDRDGDSGETTTVESVTCAVQDLVKQLWLPTDLFASSAALSSGAKRRAADGAYGGDVRTQVLNAEALLAVVWRCMPKFGGYQQHDAHEFLRYLLDRVDIELRNIDEPWPASMTPLLTSLGGDASSTVSVSSSSSSSSSSSAAPSGVSLLPRRAAAVAAAAKTSGSAPTRSSGTGVAGGAASNGVSSTSSKRDVTLGARNSLRLATAASSKEHQPTRAAAAAVAAAAPPPPPDSPTASPPTSIVKSLFGATLLSAVRCDGCRLLSTQHELHLDLSLDVPLDVPSTSLAECLDRYILPCRLDKADKYRCAHCRRAMPATKRVALESVPRILCLHFKRFRWQPPLPPKVNTLVSFPAELDMLPYVDASVRDTIATSTKYRLFAVINHLGKACGSGHYTAMCLDEAAAAATAAAAAAATAASAVTTAPSDANGASTAAEAVNDSAAAPTWIEYDDRNVRRVAFDSVVSPNAYLLFYERVDTPPSTLQPSQWIESVAADEPASNAIDDDAADGGTHLPKRMRDRI
jgi:ubiquitin C-terminal hydrolase